MKPFVAGVLALVALAFCLGCGDAQTDLSPLGNAPTVFMGDSIILGWDLSTYFAGAPYTNAGVGGQTTDQILARFDTDVVAHHPDTVVILAGTNDVIRYVPLAITLSNLQTMIRKAQDAKIRVIVGTLPPVAADISNSGPQFAGHDFNPDVVACNTAIFSIGVAIADFHQALTGPDGLPLPGVLADGIHPTSDGYKRMTSVLQTRLR